MRKRLLALNLTLVLCISATAAHAQMVFNLDFGQDGTYENTQQLGAGDILTINLYVSNVPAPGLTSMGFFLDYDSAKLQIVETGTTVDLAVWPTMWADSPVLRFPSPGRVDVFGTRLAWDEENQLPTITPILGDHIKLMTVTFMRIGDGDAALQLRERYEVINGNQYDYGVDDFLLANSIVLDEEIRTPLALGAITPVLLGDFNSDGDVDGQDLSRLAANNCPASCPSLESFAGTFGIGL